MYSRIARYRLGYGKSRPIGRNVNRTGPNSTQGSDSNTRKGQLEAVTALPYSRPLFLPIQEGRKLTSLLPIPYKLDERFVVERPFDILHLARTMSENAVRLSEGTYAGQTRLSEPAFYRCLNWERVLNAPFPRAR